jgi:hypothetical protein
MRLLRSLSSLMIGAACVAGSITSASAQGVEVTGTVSDAVTGALLSGVQVHVRGARTMAMTDSTGAYRIRAENPGDTLVFMRPGFRLNWVPVADQTLIDVTLEPFPIDAEDLVVGRPGRSAGSGCGGFHDPMPGSVYDPNWQRAHPEMARVLLGECAQLPPERSVPNYLPFGGSRLPR